jgi:hypothetical protein
MVKYRDTFDLQSIFNLFEVPLELSKQINSLNDNRGSDILLSKLQECYRKKTQTRIKLDQFQTFDDAVELIRKSNKIMVITGAGCSVSCGIPDFRSKDGIYSRLSEFNLSDPQEMFDIRYFVEFPETFYSFAHEIYPSNFKASPSHHFIRNIETEHKLLRNYTQNIDSLEIDAGIERVLQCHGYYV